ncbi:hypothetical protein KO317_03080 [Candidatus Micrarchaeota archaeon]|jgi:ssDNA-binding replication factor A large subunit|nr:hypothetical protein [Candidatus Micrarchaeota archaeon]
MESEEFLAFLRTKYNTQKIDDEIIKIISDYNGLIDKNTAFKLMAKMNGYNKIEKVKVSNIKKGMRSVNIDAEVIMFFPIYIRKGDNPFKCQRIMLKDESGTIPIVFWNEDIQILEKELSLGDKIEVLDAYENNGELNYAYRTKINIKEKKEPLPISELKEGVCSVKGRIVEIFPEYSYKKNGEIKIMASFKLMQGKEQVRVIIWENIEDYNGLIEGDLIRIESAWFKNGEIHLNSQARIVIIEKAQDPDLLKGEIKDIKLQGNEIVVLIGDILLFLKEDQIPNLFGISDVSKDITLDTIFELKKDLINNKEFSFITFEENGKVYGEVLI